MFLSGDSKKTGAYILIPYLAKITSQFCKKISIVAAKLSGLKL